jgi:uncharacterized protein
MLISDHHVFTKNYNKYVIDIEKMTAVPIEADTATALSKLTTDPNYQLNTNVKAKLTQLGLLLKKTPKEKERKKDEDIPIATIALFVTQECNLNCVYCYGDGGSYGSSGHMTTDTAKKTVDWLIEQSKNIKKLSISFFGGEPLMNFSLIKEVVEYAQKIGKKKGKTFEFGMTSNMLLLDKEKLAFLKKHKITPLVSFDGPKEIQDKQRPFKNIKKSSYDTTIPKIKKLLSVMPDTSCRATLLGNTNPVTVRKALSEIGFSKIHMTTASLSLFNKTTDKQTSNIIRTIQMLESDTELFLKNVKNRNKEELKKQKNSGFLLEVLASFLNDQKRYFPCGAGRGAVAVSNSGDVFLCHRFVGVDEYKLGHIYNNKLERTPFLKKTVNTIEKCSKCFAKYICAGWCYHDNKGSTGSVFEPSEDACQLMQKTMELTAYISCNLSENDKEYLIKEEIIPKKPLTMEELKLKQQKLMAEVEKLEELGLTEDEFKEVADGLSPNEFKNKIFSKN